MKKREKGKSNSLSCTGDQWQKIESKLQQIAEKSQANKPKNKENLLNRSAEITLRKSSPKRPAKMITSIDNSPKEVRSQQSIPSRAASNASPSYQVDLYSLSQTHRQENIKTESHPISSGRL